MKMTQFEAVTQIQEVTKRVICDVCGVDIDFDTDNHVKLEINAVECSYPECSSGTLYTYDFCFDCSIGPVRDALALLGAQPTVKEWNY